MSGRQITGELVREWAESVLQQVAAPPDAALTVTARQPDGTDAAAAAAEPTDIVATLTFADGSAVSVELAVGTRETDSVVLLADRFQDAVLEETGGTPRPPCPGHDHPAIAAEVDGVPSWICPHGMGRTARRILSDVG
ncbi:hypothetical protein ACTWQF_19705 [Streptomyces sp. 8N114]|uniref:hypothetical protein n=1 Tax=Streptomyces sp. 8N114 TaxID=3457419 RepID=UPI003FD42836